jgi:hypothetical protein
MALPCGNPHGNAHQSNLWNEITSLYRCGLSTTQVANGAILVPAGVYRITKTLDTRKNIVLRGAGKTLTTLYFPLSLTQVYGNTWSEVSRSHSGYHQGYKLLDASSLHHGWSVELQLIQCCTMSFCEARASN